MSTEMAIKLGQAFGNGARLWLTLQMQYDIWQTDQLNHDRIERIPLTIEAA